MSTRKAASPGDKLTLRYIPLSQAQRWDANPKHHDLDALVYSIELHGFGDPPKFDATLDGLVYGNGRTEALERMQAEGKPAPRGIAVQKGEWSVPVIFGVDATSKAAAAAFAVDHNNLTLMGSNLGVAEMLAMWDEEALQVVLDGIPDPASLLASLEGPDIDALLRGPDFDPVPADDQSRLDEKKLTTCPECGHAFRP